MPICRLNNITKEYRSGQVTSTALRGVSTQFEAGEFTVLAGPSGSGKTTLLNLIGCLDAPTSGELFMREEKVSALTNSQSADLRNQQIGFIFQAYNLLPVLSAFENVELPLILLGVKDKAERQAKVMEILQAVNLADFAKRKPAEMSGGQQQRVAVARALVKNPLLVLADEPTANLDSKTGQEIMDLMRKLNQERNVTFIFSSHDQMVINDGRRIIFLHDGQIKEDRRK